MAWEGYKDKEHRKKYMAEYNRKWRNSHRKEYRKYMREYHRKMRHPEMSQKEIQAPPDGRWEQGTKFEYLAAKILKAKRIGGKIDLLWRNKTVEVKAFTIRPNGTWAFGRNKDKSDWYLYFCLNEKKKIERIYFISSKDFGKTVSLSRKTSQWEKYRMIAPYN